MVRTSTAGIKISSGKSSKKGGGGSHGGGGSSSSSSTPSKKSSGQGSSRLPPIPHTETPSWQKPITNFFPTTTDVLKDQNDIESEGSPNNINICSVTEQAPDKENSLIKDIEEDNLNKSTEAGDSDKINHKENYPLEQIEEAQSKTDKSTNNKSEDGPDTKKFKA